MTRGQAGQDEEAGENRASEAERIALVHVAAAAAGASRLDEVMELAAEEACRALGAASLSVSRWEREDGLIRTLINVGELGPGEERYPGDETYLASAYPLVARMLSTRESYFNNVEDPDCFPSAREVLLRLGKGSDVGVAIVVDGAVWGELWATRRIGDRPFEPEASRFLEQIAAQCANVIARAERFTRVSQLAYEDPLTELPNRRALEDRLDNAFLDFAASGEAMAVLLCDVDGLKEINDTSGHHAGDRALVDVADALRAATGDDPQSFAGRLSGDEFCVVLSGGNVAAATDLWTGLLDALSSAGRASLSLSGGASEADSSATTSVDLLRAADSALYVAKRAGGGRLYVATDAKPVPGSKPLRPGARAIAGATKRLVHVFDNELSDGSALERLEAVAREMLEAGNFSTWTISVCREGTRSVLDLSRGDSEHPTIRVGSGADEYLLADYPVTAAAIDAGADCFTASLLDPTTDEQERRLLETLGHEWAVGVTAPYRGEVFLLEMYGSGSSAPVESVGTQLRLLARAAMPPR